MSDFADTLEATFEAAGADETTAAEAAEKIASFRKDHDEDPRPEAVEERFAEAPYDDFAHAYDWLVGDLAAANEDCTDSRAYRLAGYGDLAADPEQGA
jgi:hypothetical protein